MTRLELVWTGAALLLGLATVGSSFSFRQIPVSSADAPPPTTGAPQGSRPGVSALERQLAAARTPDVYVVIDRANNRLWVRRGDTILHEAVVSTGSRATLREAGGHHREWTFDTPAGRFRVLAKRRHPVWVKPDWAFLEEGRSPPELTRERVERGSLGEWALDIGDAFMIHGTLYERLLGRSVTHGCIRMGRDDLRIVAAAVGPGTTVYIF
jgi:L,D-transpeptidase ErfK/SrfK